MSDKPNGGGQSQPLLANTKSAKLTVGTLLTALVGGGGVLIQKGFDEVTRVENLVSQHEIRWEANEKELARLEAELTRLEQVLLEKLDIRIKE